MILSCFLVKLPPFLVANRGFPQLSASSGEEVYPSAIAIVPAAIPRLIWLTLFLSRLDLSPVVQDILTLGTSSAAPSE